jgi:hypothetical protein
VLEYLYNKSLVDESFSALEISSCWRKTNNIKTSLLISAKRPLVSSSMGEWVREGKLEHQVVASSSSMSANLIISDDEKAPASTPSLVIPSIFRCFSPFIPEKAGEERKNFKTWGFIV